MARGQGTILAFDLGTSSVKVGVFGIDGTLQRLARRDQQVEFPTADRAEQSPSATWSAIGEATREVVTTDSAQDIKAIVLSTQRGTVIPISERGEPLTNLVVWMDKRGVPWIKRLYDTVGAEDYYEVCGHPLVSYTGESKVLWFRNEQPNIWKRAACVGSPQTLFLRWLGCEDLVCDRSNGTFLFPFNIDQQVWSAPLAARMDVSLLKLPQLVSSLDVVGHLGKPAAVHLGLPSGIPLVAGGADGQLAAVGSGVTRPGLVMVNIGTAAGVQVFLQAPFRDPGFTMNCAAHVVPGAWEMEGHTQSSGVALRWLRDEVVRSTASSDSANDSFDVLIEEARTVPPGANGLLFLPYLNGSSAPVIDLEARGCFLGLTLAHQRSHVIRAVLEGISLEMRWMLDAIATLGVPLEDVRLVGGGAQNDLWNQIHADVFNRSISTLAVADAALVGAAMCAAVAIGAYPDLMDASQYFVRVGRRLEPDQQQAMIYNQAYDTFRDAFKLLSRGGIFRRLSELSHHAVDQQRIDSQSF